MSIRAHLCCSDKFEKFKLRYNKTGQNVPPTVAEFIMSGQIANNKKGAVDLANADVYKLQKVSLDTMLQAGSDYLICQESGPAKQTSPSANSSTACCSTSINIEKAPKNLGPCKICPDPANGYHFGLLTCNGCKCFFGRYVKRGDELTPSAEQFECIRLGQNGEPCPMSREVTGDFCPKCRLERCLGMGMSHGKIRRGRPTVSKQPMEERDKEEEEDHEQFYEALSDVEEMQPSPPSSAEMVYNILEPFVGQYGHDQQFYGQQPPNFMQQQMMPTSSSYVSYYYRPATAISNHSGTQYVAQNNSMAFQQFYTQPTTAGHCGIGPFQASSSSSSTSTGDFHFSCQLSDLNNDAQQWAIQGGQQSQSIGGTRIELTDLRTGNQQQPPTGN